MEYHSPTNQFTVDREALKRASSLLRYAISKIRDGAGEPWKGYDHLKRPSDWAEYAESGILDAAKTLGIDLGADRPGKLDVSSDGCS